MDDPVPLRTTGPEDTRRLAAALAGLLRPGDVVSLTGELGAGKTCFVQGAAAALGVTDAVTSPSFLLRRDYRGRMPVIHLDVYRLESLQEVLDLGFADSADRDAVAFVEWGDAMNQLLPPDHVEVELRLGEPADQAGEDLDLDALAEERSVVLRAHGPDWRRRLAAAAEVLAPWHAADEGRASAAC
jgi:tRNA threonylcarbamoyladenosine biosynthesis protein TsaE